MKRIVWTFGLIAGAIMAVMMVLTVPFEHSFGSTIGEIIGYTTMILAFLMVFFGTRAYRDRVLSGAIGFGRAFTVGILITLVASSCYVATWEVIYTTMMPDFAEKYAAQTVAKARAAGETEAQIEAKTKKMAAFVENYRNPLFNVGEAFLEVFPVGGIITLISAAVLRKS